MERRKIFMEPRNRDKSGFGEVVYVAVFVAHQPLKRREA
jgi:hypothetical protein